MKLLSVSVLSALVLWMAPLQAQQSGQMLELMQQLTRLEKEVRQLRGEVERLDYENKRLKNQQNDLYVDLDQRLRSMESSGAPTVAQPQVAPVAAPVPSTAASPANTPAVPVTQNAVPVVASQPVSPVPAPATTVMPVVAPGDPAKEEETYRSAFNLLKTGKYDEAVVAYSNFLQKYPSGTYASNAQYWLGEANYVTRKFSEAIAEFQKVIDRYPDSRKLPDAMLKIGYIHYELKQSEQARKVLTELKQKFPGTSSARLAENRLQRMKLEGR